MNYKKLIKEKFLELFFDRPLLISSPGRVNLIGEHTDYNMGFVLPAAIDKAIYFAITPRNDDICKIFAFDKNEKFEFEIDNLLPSSLLWPNYLMGVIDQIIKSKYKIRGFNCVFGGDIPIGAGLSSSAAIEGGLAFSLNYLFSLNIEPLTLVKLSQKAENEFVGVKCGIMDQYINIFGKADNALLIDCRSLDYDYYPFSNQNVSIVLLDTCISHSLASSEYNRRRLECAEGVNIIKSKYPNVSSLRDVTTEMLNNVKPAMSELIYKRCKYVVEENIRVIEGCKALKANDFRNFGSLMYQTHMGLSSEYEVSCNELDFLAKLAMHYSEIYGARMMGGGFGGCTINLIEKDAVEKILPEIILKFKSRFGREPKAYITSINSGTHIISDN